MKNILFSATLLSFFGLLFLGFKAPLMDAPSKDAETACQALDAKPQTYVESTPFTETFYNSCTDENVQISGTFHTVTRLNYDANGVPHWGSATHFKNTSGAGLSSGIKYRLVGLGSDCGAPLCVGERTVSIRCSPAICPAGEGVVTFTGVVRQRLVAQGSASDLVIEAFFHITQNATGKISVINQDLLMASCH